MEELSPEVKRICKNNYHCCDNCQIKKECFRTPLITVERVNDYVRTLNEKVIEITQKG